MEGQETSLEFKTGGRSKSRFFDTVGKMISFLRRGRRSRSHTEDVEQPDDQGSISDPPN